LKVTGSPFLRGRIFSRLDSNGIYGKGGSHPVAIRDHHLDREPTFRQLLFRKSRTRCRRQATSNNPSKPTGHAERVGNHSRPNAPRNWGIAPIHNQADAAVRVWLGTPGNSCSGPPGAWATFVFHLAFHMLSHGWNTDEGFSFALFPCSIRGSSVAKSAIHPR